MVGVAGGIGGAAAELYGALDQGDLDRGRTSPQQVKRQQRSAETGADDGNFCHSAFSESGNPQRTGKNVAD
jgi:hypothetical protein